MASFVEVVPVPTQYLPQDRVLPRARPLSFTQAQALLHPPAQTPAHSQVHPLAQIPAQYHAQSLLLRLAPTLGGLSKILI